MLTDDFDTITAISTAIGEGAIAVVRVSGPESITFVDNIYKGKNKLSTVDTHTVHYGHIIDSSNRVVDEVMVTVMHKPRTFTTEDTVEISCHGGILAVKRVLEVVLEEGARLAEPGEFTKRAFLNGRIDLSQAEAVIDIIRSKTDRAMNVALKQADGRLSKLIAGLRYKIIELMAHIEVTIDYPEHDVEEVTYQLLLSQSKEVKQSIEKLLQTAKQGKILREGLSTVIVGRPNVGKSSLLNTLIQENKAIVTDVPGTTRDVIEEYINVRGVPLRLVDTAGIRETEDIVEKIGVEKSKQALGQADLILLVLNNNELLTKEDVTLLQLVKSMNVLVIINKIDLEPVLEMEKVKAWIDEKKIMMTSIKEEEGIDQLEEAIADMFFSGKIDYDDEAYVSNSRHIRLLQQSIGAISDTIQSIETQVPIDMIQIDLRFTWERLGEITGDTVSDDLLDQIFSQFCLGK